MGRLVRRVEERTMIGAQQIYDAMAQGNAAAGSTGDGNATLAAAGIDVAALEIEIRLATPQFRGLTFEQVVSAAYKTGFEIGVRAARIEAEPPGNGFRLWIRRGRNG